MSPFILLGFLMGTILIAISAIYGELPAFPWTYRGKLKALKLDMDVLRALENAKESPELIAILRGHVQRRAETLLAAHIQRMTKTELQEFNLVRSRLGQGRYR